MRELNAQGKGQHLKGRDEGISARPLKPLRALGDVLLPRERGTWLWTLGAESRLAHLAQELVWLTASPVPCHARIKRGYNASVDQVPDVISQHH